MTNFIRASNPKHKMNIHSDLRCAYLACPHRYTVTRTGGRKYRVHHVNVGGKVWEYAQELDNTQLWICDDICEANVRWIGAWNDQPITFTRTNVRGNGDCLFEASSDPGMRTVTRTSLLNWLKQHHDIYIQEQPHSLILPLQLLAEEMLNLIKEYLVAPEHYQEDIGTSKLEAKWYDNLNNDEGTRYEVQECLTKLNKIVRNFEATISFQHDVLISN